MGVAPGVIPLFCHYSKWKLCFNGKGACPKMHEMVSSKVTAHTWDNCHGSLGGEGSKQKHQYSKKMSLNIRTCSRFSLFMLSHSQNSVSWVKKSEVSIFFSVAQIA